MCLNFGNENNFHWNIQGGLIENKTSINIVGIFFWVQLASLPRAAVLLSVRNFCSHALDSVFPFPTVYFHSRSPGPNERRKAKAVFSSFEEVIDGIPITRLILLSKF